MKKLIFAALLLAGACALTACEKEADLPEITDEEYPRILGNWPSYTKVDGQMVIGEHNAQIGTEKVIEMQYTPEAFCTAVWYLDGVEYCRGPVFRYTSGVAVTHYLRFEVTTSKHSTYRDAKLIVK